MEATIVTKAYIRLLIIVFAVLVPLSVYAADSYDLLKTEYDGVIKSGKSARASINGLGDRFYRLYASSPSGKNADYAILYAGKCYKVSYEKYGNTADSDTALKYLRITYTNYTSTAAAEGYLEAAELFTAKRDLASAQHMLNRLKVRFPGTPQEVAATSMLGDLDRMAQKTTGSTDHIFTIPPSVINTQPQIAVAPPPDDTATTADKTIPDEIADIIDNSADVELQIISSPEPNGTTAISGIRYFSADDYTRVVVDLSQNARIEKHWLVENPAQKMPPRLFIDIYDSTVTAEVPKEIGIKDGLVKSVRWAYNKPGVTRVVLDSEAIKDFTVFQMANPSRIVIDVSGDTVKTASAKPSTIKPPVGTKPSTVTATNGSQTLAGAFGLKVRTIVIDPGHGGKDPGCNYGGINEKDIVLEVSKHLRDLLKQNKDLQVYLTRETDVFIPLEERTAIANKYKADLFISVHINASKNTNAAGIETYVLNVTNDAKALELAAAENKATTKSISDLQGILKDIMLNSKLEESLLLAKSTQDHLVKGLNTPQKKNLGVKQAPFYVLVGAKMPSILVEAGFLSNTDEAKLLKTSAHRKEIAKGIHKGIENYISQYNK